MEARGDVLVPVIVVCMFFCMRQLDNNVLSSWPAAHALPPGVFRHISACEYACSRGSLALVRMCEYAVPTIRYLYENPISALPEGLFDNTPSLELL